MPNENYKAVKAEIKRLQQKAQALLKKEKLDIILSIIKLMQEYDISLKEIEQLYIREVPPHLRLGTKRSVPIKYRNEQTGESWSGRGKLPKWIVQAQLEGKTKEDFLIQE